MSFNISGKTQLICLLGSPVEHSMSPAMHNMAFSNLGLDYRYLAFDVKLEKLEEAVNGLTAINARGWNLTMPHKTKMCELVDHIAPTAKLIGAINTVVNDNGVLTGHTTDGSGYMRMLLESGIDVAGKNLVLTGAGGAARAIAVQAAFDGALKITIFNRNRAKAEALADEINTNTTCMAQAYSLLDQAQLREALVDATLFTNATQLGMEPDVEACVIEDATMLNQGLVVSDIVYHPKKTKLLQMAENQGCKTIGGQGMLLWQGADAFKLWTGQDMPVEIIQNKYFK